MTNQPWKERFRSVLSPLVDLLAHFGVTPLAVTLFGLALHVVSAIWIGFGNTIAGGILLLVAALCDALDGALARKTGQVTRFGAFLDSSVDRIDETVVLAGITAYFIARGGAADPVWAVLAVVALGGSLITSYARARAEGLGLECKVGVLERPERVAITVAGLLFGHVVLILALIVLTLFAWLTVYQRIHHVYRLVGQASLVRDDASDSFPGEGAQQSKDREPI